MSLHEEPENMRVEETHNEVNKKTKFKSTPDQFDILTKKWIKRSVTLLNLDRLNSKLLPVIPHLEEDIREAHAQGLIYLETELKEALEGEVKEMDLVEKMKKLDQLIRTAKKKRPEEKRVAPTPEQVARGAICEAKEKETEILLKEVDKIKNENKLLKEKISKVKKELSNKKKNITKDIEQFKKATMMANSVEVEELISTMKDLDMLK